MAGTIVCQYASDREERAGGTLLANTLSGPGRAGRQQASFVAPGLPSSIISLHRFSTLNTIADV